MGVRYKTSDGWKNILSSSNNAVDTVENGNMNPVTSNAVYDFTSMFSHNIPVMFWKTARRYWAGYIRGRVIL